MKKEFTNKRARTPLPGHSQIRMSVHVLCDGENKIDLRLPVRASLEEFKRLKRAPAFERVAHFRDLDPCLCHCRKQNALLPAERAWAMDTDQL